MHQMRYEDDIKKHADFRWMNMVMNSEYKRPLETSVQNAQKINGFKV